MALVIKKKIQKFIKLLFDEKRKMDLNRKENEAIVGRFPSLKQTFAIEMIGLWRISVMTDEVFAVNWVSPLTKTAHSPISTVSVILQDALNRCL